MPEPVDLGYAFTLAPEQAVEYFESKGHRISWNWFDTYQEANARAFTVAKAMRLEVLEDIRTGVKDAIRNGTTFSEFRKNLEPALRKHGWWGKQDVVGPGGAIETVQLGSVRRLKTIYRTNLQTAYMAGRWQGMVENAAERPYWMYIAIQDSATRPEHRALHGRVFRWDDPIWKSIHPPNGWGCRCRIRALTESQVKSRGVEVESSEGKLGEAQRLVSRKTGELQPVTTFDLGDGQTFSPDVGWSYNPGSAHWYPDLNRYPYATARQYIEGVLTGPPFARSYQRVEGIVNKAIAQGVSGGAVRKAIRNQLSDTFWPIAVAHPDMVNSMGAKSQVVLLSDDTLAKQILNREPGFGVADYRYLQSTMERAQLVVQEKDALHHLFFSSGESIYRATIKLTDKGELFLQSYHPSNAAQMNRAPKKGTVLVDRRER